MGCSTALEQNHHENQWAIYSTALAPPGGPESTGTGAGGSTVCLGRRRHWIYGMKWLPSGNLT